MSWLLLSFLIVAGAQPDWSPTLCVLASSVGYAIFWKGMLLAPKKRSRFSLALIWFASIQVVQLSWFFSDRYVGYYIYGVVGLLALGLGVQFAFLSLFIRKSMRLGNMLALCGAWALFEWIRLHFLSGYTWNPSGLALSATLPGMQLASLVGIFGMGFWVFFTNLVALKCLTKFSWLAFARFGVIALAPYIYGSAVIAFHGYQMEQEKRSLSALVVQPARYPEEKISIAGSTPPPPSSLWRDIFSLLTPYLGTEHQLILAPEAVVPYGAFSPIYSKEGAARLFESYFDVMPETPSSDVGNAFFAQALADRFEADVIIGLEDGAYNAAFLFRPGQTSINRYEKRILVPMGEYIPFKWCKKILSKYGILDSFTPGKEAKVFEAAGLLTGISICYEETYGHLMRESHKKGAALLVNLTNDVWYPRSRLPLVHFYHGRLRAVEAGIPLIRACNTGVTCGVDSLGRTVAFLPYETSREPSEPGILELDLPLYSLSTPYTLWGDWPVLALSIVFLIVSPSRRKYLDLSSLTVFCLRKN